jgi:hypothetical protein
MTTNRLEAICERLSELNFGDEFSTEDWEAFAELIEYAKGVLASVEQELHPARSPEHSPRTRRDRPS